MRTYFTLVIILLFYFVTAAQITGTVVSKEGEALPFVNVFIENTNRGTTTNGDGQYALELLVIDQGETLNVSFQFLGYATVIKEVEVNSEEMTVSVVMEESSTSLDEVIVQGGINPADRIIQGAVASRKKNLQKIGAYTASFYSRGLWQVKDAPDKILGQEVGDLGGGLDSTRTGIIYLSETISNIKYQRPDNFSEVIVASKVSGDDNGFSFNTASDANFSFYENTLDLNTQIISPIASNAFSYYKYNLEGTFFENDQLINKITVTPRRENDRVFTGTIYIVEDSWQLYGVDLQTDGSAIQVPFIENLNFKQNFKYESSLSQWVKISQVIDFSFGFLGLKGDGRFTAAYSDYEFAPQFTKGSFSAEILSFADQANKKDSVFWERSRPVPLTSLEINDYVKKDSIQVIRKSKKYLDSIDDRGNRFKITSPIFGYSYTDTYNKWRFGITPPIQNIQFNTVQGWNGTMQATYSSWSDEDYSKSLSAFAKANYGFSEDRLRYTLGFTRRFNRTNRATISATGGVDILQVNNADPIRPIINSYLTLTQEKNFAKYYEKEFAQLYYGQEIVNGLRANAIIAYEQRNPVFNTTDQTFFPKEDREYTSNNPLNSFDTENGAFEAHSLGKLFISATANFGQKYYSYPSGKFNVTSEKYPSLTLVYEKGFGASIADYNFDQLRVVAQQEFNVSNKGRMSYDVRAGTFLGTAKGVSFIDRQHFNGNRSLFFEPSRLNRFNVLPYYERSTNQGYVEGHAEHNFKGWILGKIPLVNKLNFNLIAGAHVLSTNESPFYREFTVGIGNVGWGKFRLLRFDYVYGQGALGGNDGAFLIGLSL
ncbi:DUF5686 and carboxypeptidase regulatory-like domain-containing protein [Dokdonia sp. 4H-3-7-5]|uniref:DUF5686 and carboxypeptidase regulatory-like domain-containing protein n=1 Tax=Dokdonia sp. (strain 4H-3-7-5) TaxID=983548 RepID=UPI00020A787A|nr:DUF5686 and carboxypeptidase regulatory-like domain-containing protein [Dokdonia sp. 4H-3-7-5]AEE18206.1 hypothetical protein Krodi_0218 [Dokdonia sp. 4H-3-7-5]